MCNVVPVDGALVCEDCATEQEREECGVYPDGGGESDCPDHCDRCGRYLDPILTAEGERYALEGLREARGRTPVLDSWFDAVAWRYDALNDSERETLTRYESLPRRGAVLGSAEPALWESMGWGVNGSDYAPPAFRAA